MASEFPLLTDREVDEVRADDLAIRLIEDRGNLISFDWMRDTFKADNGLKDELAYGTAVLPTTNHLNQYLYTYGLMIQSQWNTVLA